MIEIPFSDEAEASLLGAMLHDHAMLEDADFNLSSDDFYRAENRAVFKAIMDMSAQGVDIDIVTVSEYLSKTKIDLKYLGTMAHCVPSVANAGTYAKIIKKKSGLRKLQKLGRHLQDMSLADDANVEDIVDIFEKHLLNINNSASVFEAKKLADFLPAALDALELRGEGGAMVGTPTGFKELDDMLLGLEPGGMYVLGARPAMGKTCLGVNIAQNIAAQGGKSLIISMEMPINQLINRLWASYGVDHGDIRSGSIASGDWPKITKATKELAQSHIFVEESPALNLSKVNSIVKKCIRKNGPVTVFIDYLQIMEGDRGDDLYKQVSGFSKGLKALAKNMNVPIFVLAQLNRSVESRQDKRPTTSDLRQSGQIEQDADAVLFLYRDEIYNEDSSFAGIAELSIAKQRNGPTGVFPLRFEGEFQRFSDLSELQKREFYENKKPKITPIRSAGGLR